MSISASTTEILVGIDEAGRGPLAGPVIAGACVLPADTAIPSFIQDSKALSSSQREEAFNWIKGHCICGHGVCSAEVVDEKGILGATEIAMNAALNIVEDQVTPSAVLVDGRDHFFFPYPKIGMIKGDAIEPVISAASIIAKVIRDRMMVEYVRKYPQYAFDQHKGYGTQQHMEELRTHGLSPIHRETFCTSIASKQPQ